MFFRCCCDGNWSDDWSFSRSGMFFVAIFLLRVSEIAILFSIIGIPPRVTILNNDIMDVQRDPQCELLKYGELISRISLRVDKARSPMYSSGAGLRAPCISQARAKRDRANRVHRVPSGTWPAASCASSRAS